MIYCYQQAYQVLLRFRSQIQGWIIANEPNYTDDPATKPGRDPEWWYGEALRFLNTIGNPPVRLVTPPLQPHWRIPEWMDVVRRLWVAGQFDYVAWHLYWQQDGPESAVLEMDQWLDGIEPARILVDELNGGHPRTEYQPTLEQRITEVVTATRLLAKRGILGLSVFPVVSTSDWLPFDLGIDGLKQVFTAALETQRFRRKVVATKTVTEATPPAGPEFRFGFADFASEHPEVGDPAMNEVQLAPGVAMQMTTTGLLWFSQEAANNGIPPIRFEECVTGP